METMVKFLTKNLIANYISRHMFIARQMFKLEGNLNLTE